MALLLLVEVLLRTLRIPKESGTIVMASCSTVLYKYARVCVEDTILFYGGRIVIPQRSQRVTCAETDAADTIVFAVRASQALERLVIEFVRVLILTEPTRIRWSIQFTNRRER